MNQMARVMLLMMVCCTLLLSGCGDKGSGVFSRGLSFIGEKKYTLRGEQVIPPGRVSRGEDQMAIKGGKYTATKAGETITGEAEISDTTITETEYLSPTKVRVTYVSDMSRTRFSIAGNDQAETEPNPLDGATVIGTLKNGSWVYSLEHGIPTQKQAKELDDKSESTGTSDAIYPSKPLAVGESWDAPTSAIRSYLGNDFLNLSGSVSMHFDSIADHMGEKCAKIFVSIQVSGNRLDSDNQEQDIELGAQGHIYRSLERFVDVSYDLKGQLKMIGQLDSNLTVGITGPFRLQGTSLLK